MIIRWSHVRGMPGMSRRGGLCASGAREWCRRHNVDLRDFVRNGLDEAEVLRIGDAFALAVVEHARRVEGQGNG